MTTLDIAVLGAPSAPTFGELPPALPPGFGTDSTR